MNKWPNPTQKTKTKQPDFANYIHINKHFGNLRNFDTPSSNERMRQGPVTSDR